MECSQCGYALWNLTESRCPECGTGFDLRHYRYRPSTVAFACPHCQALHAGTGEQYRPAHSDEAVCRACGEVMAVPRMPVVPLTADAYASRARAMPWDDRARVGFFRAWWRTVVMALIRPTELVRCIRTDSGYTASYFFAFVCHLLAVIVQVLTIAVLFLGGAAIIWFVSSSQSSPSGGIGGAGMVAGMLLFFISVFGGYMLVLAVLAPLLATAFLAAPAHLALWLLEPNRERSFLVTARSVNYALAPAVLMAIPLCGLQCGQVIYIWTLVASILMLSVAHRTHGGKATLAVLWLPALMLVGYIGLVVAVELFAVYNP
ncbi:MAG: zinc ribbon domain-containing protein [Phycisphaeraceae bacterium]